MEKQMNLKRAFLILIAAMLLPGLAMAQSSDIDLSFAVTKEFTDNNPGSVLVTITCNTGLPLTQSAQVSDLDPIVFVVTAIPDIDIVECSITEDGESGYTAGYIANSVPMDLGCFYDGGGMYDNLDPLLLNTCAILNTPTPVAVNVTKEWITAGAGDEITYLASVEVRSFNPIVNGWECLDNNLGSPSGVEDLEFCIDLAFLGPSTQTRTAWVVPDWSGTTVWLDEDVIDSSIDSSNNCGGQVRVFPGGGDDCRFVNTVFFEGIPTLNQYGLAILAVLMLGVGFVGFRRFV
jgi:hypothetical protein